MLLLAGSAGAAASGPELPAAIDQGGLAIVDATPGSRAFVDGREVRVAESGRFLFGIGRDHDKPVSLRVQLPDGRELQRTVDVRTREYSIERVNGLPQQTVTPDPKIAERIARETLEQAFQQAEVKRIEAQNKALDELFEKAEAAIVQMKKVLPEKEKLVKPAQEAEAAAQKAVDEVLALIAAAPEGKADAALEKKLTDARTKLGPLTRKVSDALAAVSATKNNVEDAEAEGKRITETKTENAALLEAANAATAAAKAAQEKASAALAARRCPEISVERRDGRYCAKIAQQLPTRQS